MSGAIQVGIWESLYEEDGIDLSLDGGWFSATRVEDHVIDASANPNKTFLSTAFGYVNDSNDSIQPKFRVSPNDLRLARINDQQDLLIAVPLPGTLLLLLGGLGGLLLRRQRAS